MKNFKLWTDEKCNRSASYKIYIQMYTTCRRLKWMPNQMRSAARLICDMYRVALRQCSCEFINPQVSSTTVLGTLIWYDACGEMVWRWLKNRRHFLQVALWTHAQHSAHSKHNPKAAMHLSAFCLSVLIEVQMSMQFAQLTVIDWLGASYESRFIFFFSFFDIFGNCKKSFILHDTMWLWAIFAKLFCNFELFRNRDRHCW